jgi:tetratricopeptide (TPR) repeat protein
VRKRLVIIAAAVGLLWQPAPGSSQSLAGWESSVNDAQAGPKSLEAGIDAYQEGALEVSIGALTAALAGNLSNKQRAEALYIRGLAYRELGMPGQAILDLTSAISLKNGLSAARLKAAQRHRIGALHGPRSP